MEVFNFEQRSEEWYAIRRGVVTASDIKNVLSKSSPRSTYLYDKAAELLTSEAPEPFMNSYMQWGIDTEPQAKAYYELVTGNEALEVGFVKSNKFVGCSPDGLIGDDGLIEIKCPKTSTHIRYLNSGKMPTTYKAQVQAQLWICERQWCDFVSFDPRIANKMLVVRVERDEEYIRELEASVGKFVDELKAIIKNVGINSNEQA